MALLRLVALVLTVHVLAVSIAWAQGQSSAGSSSATQLLKAEELDALVAPIALYPDSLLSLVLMASTYPLEIVQAERWIKEKKQLKGAALKAETDKQPWDESVKSLVAAPDVLSMMSSKLAWTLKLGDAVLAQQPDVMDAIQRLRSKADANNKLTSSKEQRVTKSQGPGGRQVIAIEQTDPDTLYVPYYDPNVVYGAWPYPEYPPYYWGYPGYIGAGIIAAGIGYGIGAAIGWWGSGNNYWGGGINWSGGGNIGNIGGGGNFGDIIRNRPRVNPLNGDRWQHRPEHRQGVRYNNAAVRDKFGGNLRGAQNRMDFRGRDGNQVLRPGQLPAGRPGAGQGPGSRPGAGQLPSSRPGAGQRPGGGPKAGQRPSQRPGAGQRPGGRPSAGQLPARRGGNALGNVGSGRVAHRQAARGRASLGGRGGPGGFRGGGGGGFRGGGGGGFRGGGGGGRGGGGRGGGGRRSDVTLKHDIALLGNLPNGIGYYRFSYIGSNRVYVGVMAQEVQTVMPKAVVRDRDGSLRVLYDKLGVKFQTYEEWITTGAQIPVAVRTPH
jgi:hypothetical protein